MGVTLIEASGVLPLILRFLAAFHLMADYVALASAMEEEIEASARTM